MKKIDVAILGAGGRGFGFGEIIREYGHVARVVAVAEPRPEYREKFAQEYDLAPECVFENWQAFVAQPKMCDAVIISTMDQDHVGPALACLEKAYHILLEKPMAVSIEGCQAIDRAQRASGTIAAICHSLRYQKGFAALKKVIDEGRIGRIQTLDQLEQVQFIHQSHSFVRGNWGNQGRSTFMLMSKSCHDLDYITYLVGAPCRRITSFGSLNYFRLENAPEGSTERCTDGCPHEPECPYSAIKIYVNGDLCNWPASVASAESTREAQMESIRTGPYGRCVWRADNDVVDHQVVAMEFDGGVTATFTMTAFTQHGGRRIRVHGTEGEISFDEDSLTIKTFADLNVERVEFGPEPGGHGGGDHRVVRAWLKAIELDDASLLSTNVQESLRTHLMVFAAERSRLEKRMVDMEEFYGDSELAGVATDMAKD